MILWFGNMGSSAVDLSWDHSLAYSPLAASLVWGQGGIPTGLAVSTGCKPVSLVFLQLASHLPSDLTKLPFIGISGFQARPKLHDLWSPGLLPVHFCHIVTGKTTHTASEAGSKWTSLLDVSSYGATWHRCWAPQAGVMGSHSRSHHATPPEHLCRCMISLVPFH